MGWTRPFVMGIVNVTPDSFSDGGLYASAESAIGHGQLLHSNGADILDIGGESTRPGATRPLVEDELERVLPVVKELAAAGFIVSIDTMRHEVAAAACEAGASMVNDVSGGLADPEILRVVADAGVSYVAMHWRAHSEMMSDFARYDDVLSEVAHELARRIDAAVDAGIPEHRLVIDPGLGFAKQPHHNWPLLAGLPTLEERLGVPLLVGASRKSFLGHLLTDRLGPRPVDERESAHTALVALLAQLGVWGLRVHDVRATTDALIVAEQLCSDDPPRPVPDPEPGGDHAARPKISEASPPRSPHRKEAPDFWS